MTFTWDRMRWHDVAPKGYRIQLSVHPGWFLGPKTPQSRSDVKLQINGTIRLTALTVIAMQGKASLFNRGNPNHSALLGSYSGVRGLPDALFRNWYQAVFNIEVRQAVMLAKRWALQGVLFADAALFEPLSIEGKRSEFRQALSVGGGVRVIPTWLADGLLRLDVARTIPTSSPWFVQFGIAQYFWTSARRIMKLSSHAFKTFWSYHSWLGVVVALLLHVMFVAGIATLFKDALSLWEEPLNHQEAAYEGNLQRYLEIGVEASESTHPQRVLLVLPEEYGSVRLQYSDPSTGDWRIGWVDATHETFVPRRERLSDFLYHLHFLRLPFTGLLEWIAGLSAVALFSTLATGVLIQLHRLLPELTRFRPEAQARTFTSDLHKMLGMLGLPFQGLYAYSGALLIFAPLLTDLATEPFFFGEYDKASNALFGSAVGVPSPAHEPAADVLPLDTLVKLAEGREPDFHPDAIRVEHHLRRGALVRIYGTMSGGQPFADARMVLNQTTGAELFAHTAREDQSSNAFYRWVTGLHYADFNGMPLRFFFVLLTLGTCATLLSGNWIWLTRRDAATAGNSFLARLTAGVGAGIIFAVAGLFLLSRLIPLDIPHRILIEEAGFATLLAGCVVWAWLTSDVGSLWWKQLGLSALAFLVTPVAARLVTNAGLFGSGPRVIPVVGVDVALLVLGSTLGLVSAVLYRWTKRRRIPRALNHLDQKPPCSPPC